MTIRRISITFVALLFATISFGQVKNIDERIGEAMNSSNWAELRSLYMSDGKNLQTPFLKPLSRFFISQFYNEPDSAIKYGKEILEKYQEELNSSVPSIMYFMAEDYATLGHYDKASALLHSLNEAYRKGGQTANPVFEAYEDIYSKLSKCGTFSVERPNNNVSVPLLTSNPQPIGFSGILLAKRQNSFYCTYFLHNRNVADTKSPYPIKRLEVIRWFNQKSMVFNQSLS